MFSKKKQFSTHNIDARKKCKTRKKLNIQKAKRREKQKIR